MPTMLQISTNDHVRNESGTRYKFFRVSPANVNSAKPLQLNGNVTELCRGPVHRNSFRSSMYLTILIGQCFSLLPTSCNPSIVPRFQYCSLRVTFSAVVTVLLFLSAVWALLHEFSVKAESNRIVTSPRWIFLMSSGIISVVFFRIAMQWPRLCLYFLRAERDMKTFGYPPCTQQRMIILTVTILGGALVEHTVFIVSRCVSLRREGYETLYEVFLEYLVTSFPYVQKSFPHNAFILFICQILLTSAAFMWSYSDLFIMLISTAIAQLFKQLTTGLQRCSVEEQTPEFWRDAREQYNALAGLTREVDQILGFHILFSAVYNLYFICIQLLHTIQNDEQTIEENVFFMVSMAFLIARTVFVSVLAASVNDESLNVRKNLLYVSCNSYCNEVQRFIVQAATDDIALSGFKCFNLTRSFLLTLAGSIVTYEIILLQFNMKRVT